MNEFFNKEEHEGEIVSFIPAQPDLWALWDCTHGKDKFDGWIARVFAFVCVASPCSGQSIMGYSSWIQPISGNFAEGYEQETSHQIIFIGSKVECEEQLNLEIAKHKSKVGGKEHE